MKVFRKAWQVVIVHLRIGYVGAAALVAFLFLLAVLVDYLRFELAGYHPTSAIELSLRQFEGQRALDAVGLFVLLTCGVPVVLAAIRVLTGNWRHGRRGVDARDQMVVLSVVLLSACTAGLAYSAMYFPQTAGLTLGSGSRPLYAFKLWLTPFVLLSAIAVGGKLIAIVSTVIITLAGAALLEYKSSEASSLRRYFERARLADLKGAYYPLHGRHRHNFNAGGLAPAILAVRQNAVPLVDEYQALLPGSIDAATWLLRRWNEARELLAEMLVTDGANASELIQRLYLFDSTSRALDVILMLMKQPVHVVLSPYEHPAEDAVSRYHSEGGRASVARAKVGDLPALLGGDAAARAGEVADAIVAVSVAGCLNVVIVSDVCYLTGRLTACRQIVDALKAKAPNLDVFVVIDGAHSAGHYKPVSYTVGDAFIFSGHKWLLSDGPSGVLLLNRTDVDVAAAYDAWHTSLPVTTANVYTVTSLLAALRWQAHAAPLLAERSTVLLGQFRKKLSRSLEIVGNPDPKARMFAVRPANGYKWISGAGIRQTLAKVGFSVEAFTIIGRRSEEVWVRVSLPFFLDGASVGALNEKLAELVEPMR